MVLIAIDESSHDGGHKNPKTPPEDIANLAQYNIFARGLKSYFNLI